MLGQLSNLSGGNVDEFLVRMGVETTGMRDEVHRTMQDLKQEVQRGIREMGQVPAGGLPINRELDRSIDKASTLSLLLKGAAVGGITAIVTALGLATKAAIDFEDSFSNVLKVVDGTPAQIARLKQEFRDLAAEIHQPVDAIDEIGAAAAALGVPIQNLKDVVRIAAQMGQVTDMSAQQSMQALGNLGQVLGLTEKDYQSLASTIVDLGDKSVATESQITAVAQRTGAAGKELGLTTQQVLALSDAAASLGGDADTAGTALERIYTTLGQMTSGTNSLGEVARQAGVTTQQIATLAQDGTDAGQKAFGDLATKVGMTTDQLKGLVKTATDWQAAAKALGLNDQAFREQLAESPAKALESLFQSLGAATGTRRTQALQALGLDDARSQATILGLVNNIGLLTKALGESNDAWAKGTALADDYKKKTADIGTQIGALAGTVHGALTSLGETVLPVLSQVVAWLSDEIPKAIKEIGGLWHDYLAKPFGDLWDSVVKVGRALGGILFDWSGDGKGGQAAGIFEQIAAAMGAIAEDAARVVGFLGDMLGNPVVQAAVKLAAALAAVNLAMRGIRGLVGMGSGAGNFLFGGLGSLGGLVTGRGGVFGGGPSAASQWGWAGSAQSRSAEENIARTHMSAAETQMSAAEMQLNVAKGATAAAAQMQSLSRFGSGPLAYSQARLRNGQFVSMPYNWRNNANSIWAQSAGLGYADSGLFGMLPGVQGNPYLNSMPVVPGRPGPAPGTAPEDLAASQRMLRMSEGELAAQARNGTIGALQRGLYRAKGAISDGVGLISKAFWPVFIGDMIGNMAAQPIGDWISQHPGWERVKIAAQKGWLDGLTGVLDRIVSGTDAWVGRAPAYTLQGPGGQGATTIPTQALRALGVDTSGLDTIDNNPDNPFATALGGRKTLQDILSKYAPPSDTNWFGSAPYLTPDTAQQLADALGITIPSKPINSGDTAASMVGAGAFGFQPGPQGLGGIGLDDTAQAAWQRQVNALIQQALQARFSAVDTAIDDALTQAAQAKGFALPGYSLAGLSNDKLQQLMDVLGGNAPSAFAQYATRQITGNTGSLAKGSGDLASAMAALSTNVEGNNKALTDYATWVQQHEGTADYKTGYGLLQQYGAGAEAANGMQGTPDQVAAARKPIIEALLGDDATKGLTTDAMNQLWADQIWPAFQYAEQATGADQRGKLADQFGGVIGQALKDGVPWEDLKAKYGAQMAGVLYDGVGDERGDIAQRLGNVIADVFGDSITNAGTDPALQKKVVDQFNTMFGTSLSGSAGFKQVVTAYVQSLHDEMLAADAQGPDAKQQFADYVNQHVPQGILTPAEIDKALNTAPTPGGGGLADALALQIVNSRGDSPVKMQLQTTADGFVSDIVADTQSADNAQKLLAAGASLWEQVSSGVANSTSVEDIIQQKLGWILGLFGQSPPRYGPLKHPRLQAAGRNIMAQVQEGVSQTGGVAIPGVTFSRSAGAPRARAAVPGFASAPGGAARAAMSPGSGAMSTAIVRSSLVNQRALTQHISVDQMTVLGPQDRSTLVRQFRFMSGE